jgi:hypothetical protein
LIDRPDGACLTHLPPKPNQPWRRADPGYRTCSACYDRIHRWLSPIAVNTDGRPDSIPGLYALLDATPGEAGPGRRAPGFGSRSPANDHIIAMTDQRSIRVASGDPHSVPGVLGSWCREIFEERQLVPPKRTVADMARFLDTHLDWLSRQDWIADFHCELRELHSQLRSIGQQRRRIGLCPVTIDEGDTTRECGAALFAPLAGDEIVCWSCGERWPRDKWLRLGDLLDTG